MSKLRKFYTNNDIGNHNNASVFCYTQQNDTNNTLTVGYGYINSIIFEAVYHGKPTISATFCKDEHGEIQALIYSVDDTLFISKVVKGENDFKLDEPIELETQSAISSRCLKAVISAEHAYVTFYNEYNQHISVLCYSFPEFKLQTGLFSLPYEVSSRYLDAMTRQINANITLMSDKNNGIFIQFLNPTGSLNVCKIMLNSADELESAFLFSVEATHIGYHNSIFDSAARQIVTIFSTANPAGNPDYVYAMTSKIFMANQAPKFPNIGATPISASLGHYYRPQILNVNGAYVISWEGREDVTWCATDANLLIIAAEEKSIGTLPGNHRLTVIDGHTTVSWQDDCQEPRFSGLQIKNYTAQK